MLFREDVVGLHIAGIIQAKKPLEPEVDRRVSPKGGGRSLRYPLMLSNKAFPTKYWSYDNKIAIHPRFQILQQVLGYSTSLIVKS